MVRVLCGNQDEHSYEIANFFMNIFAKLQNCIPTRTKFFELGLWKVKSLKRDLKKMKMVIRTLNQIRERYYAITFQKQSPGDVL